ncbi:MULTISPECIES: pyrroline-5-carboxylate reductase [unclassified Hyphomicrobium]|uniref:pyrroline-5-carboxylate reductase n=1 Tax=unclassified Hyphomicrobium TaxID=2619925 RepID=UPI000213EF4E|nr:MULTISPECIES: pyrroline-5-carboxylate reductase [unclassified Hyphomicrobium]CCB64172.1 pyrroline-5-carboxylate reductase [Hyphomicrobium sp. MC1]
MSLKLDGSVVLAGAGKMGTAMLAGWLERGLDPAQVIIQEPKLSGAALELAQKHGIASQPVLEPRSPPPAVIVVAVKPQAMDDVFPALAKIAGPQTVVMSIAAGKTIASFERHLPAGVAVLRAMPNTPAAIGRGITGAVANAHTTQSQKAACEALLGAVGDVVWVPEEDLIDAVTAVSGSGPAYVFLLAEALADAGVAAGLDAATAKRLATATVSGAGELLHQSKTDPATLRQNVTSPGGTTAAALAVLMRDGSGLKELMTEAVLAAEKRGRELGH